MITTEPLCPACQEASQKWLNYRLPPTSIQLCTPGRTTTRSVQEGNESRYRQWKDTINSQQALIADICRSGRCATKRPSIGAKSQ